MSAVAPVKLKIRGPTGDVVLSAGLSKASTFSQLQAVIADKCAVPAEQQQLSATYPPPVRVISAGAEETLASLKIQSGDMLLLKQVVPPSPPAASITAPASSPQPASLESLSHLVPLRVVSIPDDNSCLFNSVGLLMEGAHSQDLMTQLREVVASVILADADQQYSEAFLGGSTKEAYVASILKSATWGGGIELAILAEYFDVEIATIDVETCHQYLFGNSGTQKKSRRIYCVYSGVHYDALVDEATSKRVFSSDDEVSAQRALLAARLLQAKGAFTNVSSFTLRCSVCQTGIVGAVEAQDHAKSTGHQQFEEYKDK